MTFWEFLIIVGLAFGLIGFAVDNAELNKLLEKEQSENKELESKLSFDMELLRGDVKSLETEFNGLERITTCKIDGMEERLLNVIEDENMIKAYKLFYKDKK